MKIQFDDEVLDKCREPNSWDFGNKVLYDLCSNNFTHNKGEVVISKVWLIGRAYSVALERRNNKADINDNFYIDTIAPAFLNSDIDSYLTNLHNIKCISMDAIPEILTAHHYLMSELFKITEDNKRSFCSKYFHFHLPDLFYIYDTRAETALRNFVKDVPKDLKHLTKLPNIDLVYAKFICKSFELQRQIEKERDIKLTTRQLDNLLVQVANERLVTKRLTKAGIFKNKK